MSHLLDVQNLSITFSSPDGDVQAVKKAAFHVDKGEILAIVGESGSGKTVSALSIPKLLPATARLGPDSSIRFDGRELIGTPDDDLRRLRGGRVSMIFQEPMTSLNPLHTIGKQIGESLAVHQGLAGPAARERIIELLRMVGLDRVESRLKAYPHQLSGGQRQRVMIAIALANEPDLLIADEPTTALDVTIQAQILALLKDLQARLGMAVILITHDLGVVAKVADRVVVMNDGQVVEEGPVGQITTTPSHPYTQHLIASEPSGSPVDVPDGAETVIEIRDLRVHFPITKGILRRTVDYVRAVDGISASIRRGQTIGVVGESGSGKTTLGLAMLRLIDSNGRVVFMGDDLQRRKAKAMRPLREKMQVVFQDPYGALSPRMTISEIIGEGLKVYRPDLDSRAYDAKVEQALGEVGLPVSMKDRLPHELSGGQRQRVSIARAMILDPVFVVLDEPTSALDLSIQAQIVDLLRDLQAKHHIAFLFISHDMKVVRALSHYVIVMKDGKVVEEGPCGRVFDEPKEAYTRALMAAALDLEAVGT
jgi:microcin C transport system ATP-binding protein